MAWASREAIAHRPARHSRARGGGITYDVMGNIKTLNRYQAGTIIDSLLYTYTGNQPGTIADRSTDAGPNGKVAGSSTYTYDGNGNVSANTNVVNTGQNKSYTYNLLNLPQVITVPGGSVTYTYDATGRKLRKVAVNGATTTTTEYIDGIQYLNSATAIDFIATEEGRADVNGADYDYQYYMGDNLGNTRITFGTKTGGVMKYQTDDYYPFGLEINSGVTSPKNEYLYNKKELQEELGQYDYGARFYDPVIARWQVVDPMAEISRRWSPYNYVENNPIRMIDPDGMSADDESSSERRKRHNKEFDERIAKEKQAFEDAKNGATIGISSDYQVQDNQPVGESSGNVATGTLNSKEDGGKKDKIADRGNADVDQGSFPLASPTDPNVFVFRLRDNLIHTNIFYSENYIYIDFDEIQKSKIEHVLINSINVWIPNESFFQNKFWLHKLPYLRDAFAAIVDDVRATVNEEWMNGRLLRGAPVMKQRFMQLFRSRIQEGFPGATIDFGPNASTFTRSLVVHNVL